MDKIALRQLLAEAEEQRRGLDATIKFIRSQLGETESAGTGNDGSGSEGHGDNGPGLPDATVRPGEFFGMSGPKAAEAVLEKFGRSHPLKTADLFKLIREGGCDKISTEDVLYRSLFRDPKFLKVGRGVWGLAKWYPPSARKAAKAAAEDEAQDLGLTDDPDAFPEAPPVIGANVA